MRIAILAMLLSACTVSRKSDQLACTNSSDCNNGRTCQMGYCVSAGAICPTTCTSCDLSTQPPKCMIDGNGGNSIACPSGMDCEVICSGTGACGSITCGGGGTACTVTCTGTASCGSISCTNACSCDVICAPGDCGTNSCPRHGTTTCATSTSICSSGPPGCSNC